jgi:phospholipid-translocating ATPase
MGIMIRSEDRIVYYLKGADTVLQNKIPQIDAHFMAEACLDLANEGLRTLVIAKKELTSECISSSI